MTRKKYDAKKLAKIPNLKKKIALFLAREEYLNSKTELSLSIIDILAFGVRPFISFSEKDLIKKFDESYNKKLEHISLLEKKSNESPSWLKHNYNEDIKIIKAEISAQEELMNEILEDSFSE